MRVFLACFKYFLGAMLFAFHFCASAQESDKKNYLYQDLNNSDKSKIVVLSNNNLSLQYHDSFGQWKYLPLKMYNWKGELVADVALEKVAGLNYFNIDLGKTISDFEDGKVRLGVATDEVGTTYELVFRFATVKPKDLTVQVFVNPKVVHCDDPLLGNYVEFYGGITNGKAPYKVDWYVMNINRTDYIYQPKAQQMERPGSSAVIAVDKSPDYYVIMVVHDACGNEQYQVVQVVCDQGEKKINTVFFENIDDLKRLGKTIN